MIFQNKQKQLVVCTLIGCLLLSSCGSSPPARDVETITFAADEELRSQYEPIMEQFHDENLAITVQFVSQPESSQNSGQILASAADTFLALPGSTEEGRYFRDLGPLMEMDTAFEPEDFWPGLLSACRDAEGQVLGIPIAVRLRGIIFDEAAFDAAGLPYPLPGWTFADFQQAASVLARQDDGGDRAGFLDSGHITGSILAGFVHAHLEDFAGQIDAPSLADDLQWYLDMVSTKTILPIGAFTNSEQSSGKLEALMEGSDRPAMWSGAFVSTQVDYTATQATGFAPFPVATDGSVTRTTPLGVECAAMSAGTAHPQAAWSWLSFLTSQRSGEDQVAALVQAPVRRSIAEASGYWQRLPEEVEPSVRFILDHGLYSFPYDDAFSAIESALLGAIRGDSDLVTGLDRAHSEVLRSAEASTHTETAVDESPITVATPIPALNPADDISIVNYFYAPSNPQEENAFGALIDAFHQKYPQIEIQWTSVMDVLGEDLISSFAEKYDCFAWSPPSGPNRVDDVLPLNSFLEAEEPSFHEDFYPILFDPFRDENDQLVAIPVSGTPALMAYNADLLARRGLAPPASDWTFDDFIRLMTAASSKVEADQSYGYLYTEGENLFFAGQGIRWINLVADPEPDLFNRPEMINTLSWLRKLSQSGQILVYNEETFQEAARAIASGKVAFWISFGGQPDWWWTGDDEDEVEPNFRIGLVPMPETKESSGWSVLIGGQGHYISRQAEDPQACWKWMKYLSERPGAFPGIPARRSVAEGDTWDTNIGVGVAIAYRDALERATQKQLAFDSNFLLAQWPLDRWLSNTVKSVLAGEDPNELLLTNQQKADIYLACITVVDIDELNNQELQEKIDGCARQADSEGQW